MKIYSSIAILMLLSSCTYESMPSACDSIETVSFSKNILPVFNQHCGILGCHASGFLAGNLNLEPSVAYIQLNKRGKGYIDTLNPGASVLYSSMASSSNPMP
ncbi:MAG: hypothetical protein ABI761_20180, partial [Saprospiraceae bacterium]